MQSAENDAARRVSARIEALCTEAESGEGIVLYPGHNTYHVVEVGRLREALNEETR